MSEALHTLISGLPHHDAAAWTGLAEKALRGADFDETLVRRTADGIQRGPVFFTAPRGAALGPTERDAFLPWQIRQVFTEATPEDANAAILADLMGGVSQIGLQLDDAGQFGLTASSSADFARTFNGVDLSIAPTFLEPGHNADAAGFADWAIENGAKTGGLGLRADDTALVDLAHAYPGWRIATIDARCVHETGGSEAQELAYALAGYAEAIGRLVEGGIDIAQAQAQVEIIFAVDPDIHTTLAKLRAALLTTSGLLAEYRLTPGIALIRCVNSQRVITRKDPWTNLIRLSAAGFAAACTGAQTLTLYPATQALGRPDRMARRFARNLHILLQEESHLGGVIDPAAGSYLHETLTAELAQQAWMMFQQIEAEGGFGSLDESSAFTRAVESKRDELEETYRSGKATLFGINKFAADDLREMRFEPGIPAPSSDPLFPAIRLEDAALEGVAS